MAHLLVQDIYPQDLDRASKTWRIEGWPARVGVKTEGPTVSVHQKRRSVPKP